MKKRQRKKLKRGEFRQKGFKLSVTLKRKLDSREEEQFARQVMAEAIEANKLEMVGELEGDQFDMFVTPLRGKEPEKEATDALGKWLEGHEFVDKYQMGELEEA